MTASPLERATGEFADALAQWRVQRGLTKRALATEMGFDPSYVSHVEGRRHRPTQDFARRAEVVLRAGGEIWRSYATYESVRQSVATDVPAGPAPAPARWIPPNTGLVIEREHARLSRQDRRYVIHVRRELYNAGADPVVRFPVRIRVDRYPAEPRRSARLHHSAPLTWAELDFTAITGAGEALAWRASYDSDSLKELWVHLENPERRMPLEPGGRLAVEYAYRIGEDKFGPWFQRTVRLPTHQLTIEADFPVGAEPVVWGTTSSLSVENAPLGTPLAVERGRERVVFAWSTRDPLPLSRFRLEWRYPG
jgi:transcriptional regulator with XRE-family HTH domain